MRQIVELSKNRIPSQMMEFTSDALKKVYSSDISGEPLFVIGIKTPKDLINFIATVIFERRLLMRWLLIFDPAMDDDCTSFHKNLDPVHKEMSVTVKCSDDHQIMKYYTNFVKTEIIPIERQNGKFQRVKGKRKIISKTGNSTHPRLRRIQVFQ